MSSKYPKSFKDVKCDILGVGVSNIALLKLLHREGAIVTARSKNTPSPEILQTLNALCKRVILGERYLDDLNGQYIFRSPSIRPDLPEIGNAVSQGATLGSEWELFFHRAPCQILGITGSDGKTTTVTIAEKLLNRSFLGTKRKAYAAGNIGIPLISLLDTLKHDDIVVAELSSFQLMTLDKAPESAAITNITENHLDYHYDMDEYVHAKLNIFGNNCKRAIIPEHSFFQNIKSSLSQHNKKVITSGFDKNNDIYCCENQIYYHNTPILNVSDIVLSGKHNIANYMTAIALCDNFINSTVIRCVASTFSGVEHRAQLISEINGVRYYDSSIDSTPSRTAVTLSCFDKPLTVICGGYDKNLDYSPLADALEKHATAVIVTGSSAPKLLAAINALHKRSFSVYHESDFDSAVRLSTSLTVTGGTVLLSPACASYDRFSNYKERGTRFAQLVTSIT